MKERIMDKLYNENLQLGNRINNLTDENNFYKIQINNFNKLTNSINKDLYKLGINFQNKQIIEDSAKVGPLFIISNKIKLKNLQLKIGNSIRHTEKFKKNLEGSLPFITKQIENLQEEVSILLAKYLQMKEENQLLGNIQKSQQLFRIHKQFKQEMKKSKIIGEISAIDLQNKKKQTIKKLQYAKKQKKQKSRTLAELTASNQALQQQIRKIKSRYPENTEVNHQRARQAKQLQQLQAEQKKIMNQIAIRMKQLEQQYTINKECKQRINDKKYQENKEIKVLEEEVQKCRDQLREFKFKYKKIRNSSVSGAPKKDNDRQNGN